MDFACKIKITSRREEQQGGHFFKIQQGWLFPFEEDFEEVLVRECIAAMNDKEA